MVCEWYNFTKGAKMSKKMVDVVIFATLGVFIFLGCSTASSSVKKITKPMDKTEEEIVKVRELKSDGKTRAVLSPTDQKQLKIPF